MERLVYLVYLFGYELVKGIIIPLPAPNLYAISHDAKTAVCTLHCKQLTFIHSPRWKDSI